MLPIEFISRAGSQLFKAMRTERHAIKRRLCQSRCRMEAVDQKVSRCKIGGVTETIMVETDDQRMISFGKRAKGKEFMYRQLYKYVVK